MPELRDKICKKVTKFLVHVFSVEIIRISKIRVRFLSCHSMTDFVILNMKVFYECSFDSQINISF